MRTNSYATSYTRTGKIDMLNKKPFRTPSQKDEARSTARLVEGRYVSNAPVSYHRAGRQQVQA
jgi:hypothetical protein